MFCVNISIKQTDLKVLNLQAIGISNKVLVLKIRQAFLSKVNRYFFGTFWSCKFLKDAKIYRYFVNFFARISQL